jgi:hypothetical protein
MYTHIYILLIDHGLGRDEDDSRGTVPWKLVVVSVIRPN